MRDMKLECQKCKYAMDKDAVPNRCPYCGEFGTVSAKKTASDILTSVEKGDLTD